MNQTSQTENWKKGLIFSLITVLFWSTLPVSLKISMSATDAMTLTWFRFLVAALFTLLLLLHRNKLKEFKGLVVTDWLWLGLAALMLIGNYVLFLIGLEMTSPANAQVFIQMAPLLMTLGGVLIFKEAFNRMQFLGVISIITGLILFFNDQIKQILSEDYSVGIWVMFAAALTWAIYALIQKKLAGRLSSQSILGFIYAFATLALFYWADLDNYHTITTTQWLAIAYACINTVIAYGAFGEAISHWNASRVGMVLALTPVTTLLFINAFAYFFNDLISAESIQLIGYIGMAFIVTGSMLASLKK
ncbi:DMT family transporter [Marinicella sp. S1101]|uniref:DMT family transporter n=1 Tax=Marinicella marina TaxID=2996016 RepID=UPI0022609B8A|nr:DMT family transporter [Marinicella marina]MCX7554316.1 DMT family transporter [Marinicella marina]MDJ1138693.1 DMT family transporter [Marinicella marina]